MTITLNKNRILSALVAVIYIVGAFVTGGGEASCMVLLFVILPLACIWFSDAMGGYTGLTTNMPITAPSPGLIVCILGWLLLLLPLIMGIINYAAAS
jgi:putative effector of murein hydrolase LrgA (UPF0299 family)